MRLDSVGAEVGLGSIDIDVELAGIVSKRPGERAIRERAEAILRQMLDLVNAPTLKLAVFGTLEEKLTHLFDSYEKTHPEIIEGYRRVYEMLRVEIDKRVPVLGYLKGTQHKSIKDSGK